MTRDLGEWPRPENDTGIGLHLSSQVHEQRWHDPRKVDSDCALWTQMGVCWLKLFVDGLSQVKAAEEFTRRGFEVIVRLYSPWGAALLDTSWPVDVMQAYKAAGVHYIEAFNEPELELGLGDPPGPGTIERLAAAYIRFADACAHAGVIPCTPAFQGDRVLTWFRPFLRRVIEMGRRDALEGSAIAVHARPLNHPPTLPPPGFVFRSYETFDDLVQEYLGGSLPILGTEAGYEPGDSQDATFPPITLGLHADYNVVLACMEWRPALFCQCFWLWCGGWGGSDWIENRIYDADDGAPGGTLPVVKAFMAMAKPVRNGPSTQPTEGVWPEQGVIERIREVCWNNLYPQNGIPRNPAAAFQRVGINLGAPVTKELRRGGWAFQGFVAGILYCKEGDWGNIQHCSWT